MLESRRPPVAPETKLHKGAGPSCRRAVAAATPIASRASSGAKPRGAIGASMGSSRCASAPKTTRISSARRAKLRNHPRTVSAWTPARRRHGGTRDAVHEAGEEGFADHLSEITPSEERDVAQQHVGDVARRAPAASRTEEHLSPAVPQPSSAGEPPRPQPAPPARAAAVVPGPQRCFDSHRIRLYDQHSEHRLAASGEPPLDSRQGKQGEGARARPDALQAVARSPPVATSPCPSERRDQNERRSKRGRWSKGVALNNGVGPWPSSPHPSPPPHEARAHH